MPFGFITCGPNEALVISGCCYGQPAYIAGGRKFIFPVIQQAQKLSLNVMTLKIESPRIYTQLGVPITVTGVAQVKIKGDSDEMLSRACELFLGKPESEIADIIRNTLEGHQRAMMGNMTVEEIYKDRKKFSKAVFDVATSDFINMGVTIVNYVIKDISDDENYLKSLGKPRTAQVKAEARKGEAEATRDSGIKEALAEQERVAARLENDILIAQAKRDYELKQATYDMEVQTQKCQSDLSYSLQSAKTRQKIKDEEMQIKVVERTRQIQVQELEIVRRERYLDGSVRKPAEAEKYRLQTIAEAEKAQKIKEAQAEAEAVRIKGEADAYAITAKAKAEAEQMAKKAEAFNEFRDAAKLDMLLEALPKVAAELAAPLSQAKKVTLVSSGDGDVGAAKLTGEVLVMMERLPKMINTMTGIDIAKQMKVA